jgi:integrase
MVKLSDAFVRTALAGEYSDDRTRGLTLLVRPSTAKGGGDLRRSWVLRFTLRGKRKRFGLGPYPQTSLKRAREKAAGALGLIAEGKSPIDERVALDALIFARVVDKYLIEALPRYRHEKTRENLVRALRVHCAPLAPRSVDEIAPLEIASLLKALAQKAPGTAETVRGALRGLFAYARLLMASRGVDLSNPTAPDLLKAAHYAAPTGPTRGNHPALDHRQMAEFMQALHSHEQEAARLLEFIILTVARTGAARFARIDQIDFEQRLWRIPVAQLKDARHRKGGFFIVPLSAPALAIAREMKERVSRLRNPSPFLFCDAAGVQLNDMATIVLLRRICRKRRWADPDTMKPISVHGFRSTFRSWAQATDQRRDAVELSMGHRFYGVVESRYAGDDLREARRAVLDLWANHCLGANGSADVIPLRRA